MYTADYLIQRRKDKWEELHSIDHDKKLRAAIANEMLTSKELLEEIKANPKALDLIAKKPPFL